MDSQLEPDAFFVPLRSETRPDGRESEVFRATRHTAGPWGPTLQHGGTVAGLLTRALERCAPRADTRLARVAVDILGPVLVGDVRVSAEVVRPGRRIELLSASLETPDGAGGWREAATARAWRLVTADTSSVARSAHDPIPGPPAAGDSLREFTDPRMRKLGGFVEAVSFDVVHEGRDPGDPSIAWLDLTLPLVAGEETSDLVAAIAVADVTNGLGMRLDITRWTFLNTDLTVQLFDAPEGPWFGLRAETSVGSDGVGMGEAVLYGPRGPIGRVTQNLLVERRPD